MPVDGPEKESEETETGTGVSVTPDEDETSQRISALQQRLKLLEKSETVRLEERAEGF